MTDVQTSAQASALTGTQKVAVVLMNMNHERAAEVMKQFTDNEAEEIAAEIVRLRQVDTAVTDETLNEFHALTTHGRARARGGKDFAAGLLEASFGADRAAGVMNRVASSSAGKSFEFLNTAEPGQIQILLDGELPQTIALVLAHLPAERASAVIGVLAEPARTDVAHAIATMSTAAPESVSMVAASLKVRAGAISTARTPVEVVGGIQPLVDILNRTDVATERALLEALDARDPQLAEEVRSRMVTFADVIKLEERDVQQVLRGMDPEVLALALKGATTQVADTIRNNLSERNREFLDEEIKRVGAVRASQVEDARAEIVRSIRDLVADGSITMLRGDEDAYVD